MQESEIFEAAVAERVPEKRRELLERLCGADRVMRDKVESLLRAHEAAGPDFLKGGGAEVAATVLGGADDLSGARVGAYKLLQKIGEGGFGAVYMAEQQEPVRRKVAFKVIKPGMDSREVIARFESERQALAMMEHPNIAQVLDAGTTPGGQPYFVMELVRGVPITNFCDRNRLTVPERLKLFLSVCHAVQHAHHKGIIHRDIKPSNVMVTLHDGVPVVKVIDFGVAKATAQRLTEKTLFTAYGQMVGTPAYMSPEQAEMSGLDIDTRSDVYSLGVLLYELLTGSTPLDVQRLREAGFVQMQKLIAEQEAQRPSVRVSSLGGEASILAGNRGTDMKRWSAALRGDLDWIVMKSLEKDRNRRYGTPTGLAADLDRYLKGDAIEARPPSLSYRGQRLFQKHKTLVLTTAGIFMGLLAATVISTALAFRALRAERLAEQRREETERAGEALRQALTETRAAQRKAERLGAEIIISEVTTDFDESTLLRWSGHLNRLAQTDSEIRDYVKLSLLGAVQFLAGYEGGEYSQGYLFASPLKVHALEQGLLAYGHAASDLAVVDLTTMTNQELLQVADVGGDGAAVVRVIPAGAVIVVCDDAGRIHTFSRETGRRRQTQTLCAADTAPETWGSLVLDQAKTRLACKFGAAPARQRLVVLEIATGTCVEIPLAPDAPSEVLWRLSPDGNLLAMAVDNPSRLQLWNTREGTAAFEIPLGTARATALEFWPEGNRLAVSAVDTDVSEERQNLVQVWNLQSRQLDWKMPARTEGLQILGPGIIADLSGAWVFDRETATPDENRLTARRIDQPLSFGDTEWLVNTSLEVFRRSDFVREERVDPKSYSPHLQRFAVGDRYLRFQSVIYDLKAQRKFPGEYWNRFEYDSVSKWVACGNPGYFQMTLPTDPGSISDDECRALTELIACGNLDDQGRLVSWNATEFKNRLDQALASGWLSESRFPVLADFVRQPAFFWKRKVQDLALEAQRQLSSVGRQEVEERLAAAWNEVQARDNSFRTQWVCLGRRLTEEKVGPAARIGRELPLARRYGGDFWRAVGYDQSRPALAYDAELSSAELKDLVEFWRLQREYWEAAPRYRRPSLLLDPWQLLAEAFASLRGGNPGNALNLLDRLTSTIVDVPVILGTEVAPDQAGVSPLGLMPAGIPEVGITLDEATKFVAVLACRILVLAELNRVDECRPMEEKLARWLTAMRAGEAENRDLAERIQGIEGLPEMLRERFADSWRKLKSP